jgi:hypothetical protein
VERNQLHQEVPKIHPIIPSLHLNDMTDMLRYALHLSRQIRIGTTKEYQDINNLSLQSQFYRIGCLCNF